MKEKKRITPMLSGNFIAGMPTFEDEATIDAVLLENEELYEADFHHLFIKESHIKKFQMPASRLSQFECVNVVFEHCDFSNSEWIGSGFHQVEFRQCKLTGCNFAEAYLKDCLFSDCILDYASFSMSTMKVVHFEESSLRQAEFSELDWQHLKMKYCQLTQSQWFNTPLKNLDFSENQFDTIALSPESIRGMIVNAEQALTIAETLGIILK